jgi:hypothetical protein
MDCQGGRTPLGLMINLSARNKKKVCDLISIIIGRYGEGVWSAFWLHKISRRQQMSKALGHIPEDSLEMAVAAKIPITYKSQVFRWSAALQCMSEIP